MPDDRIWDAYASGGFRPRLVGSDAAQPDERAPLVLQPARLPDPDRIPPRQWLYGTQLIRGYVTVLVAPGGTGKSAYAMAAGLELSSETVVLGEHVFMPVNVSIFNLEDKLEELERRLAALMIRHKVPREKVLGRYFLNDGGERGLTMAALDDDGFTIVSPDEKAMIAQIHENNIGLVVCDPFAESHTLEENSNPQMVKAAGAWRNVARATNCAILLVHHVRKGEATGIDAARGAKALTDSARVGLLLTTMTEQEGENFGIAADERWQYVRLDDAKRNMAPAAKARWFKLDQVSLGNTFDPLYPKGDKVAAIVAWEPPSLWQDKPPADLNAVLTLLQDGPSTGMLYSRRKSDRWAGAVLVESLGVTDRQAKQMIDAWVKSGLLVEVIFSHPQWRRDVPGLRVDDSKRPT